MELGEHRWYFKVGVWEGNIASVLRRNGEDNIGLEML